MMRALLARLIDAPTVAVLQWQAKRLRDRLMRAWVRIDQLEQTVEHQGARLRVMAGRLALAERDRSELREIAGTAYLGAQLIAADSRPLPLIDAEDDPADLPQTTA